MRKIKLSVKLLGGFSVMAFIVLLVGFVGWNGLSRAVAVSRQLNQAQNVAKEILKREIDHLNWAKTVGQFQRDENATTIDVEKDDHKCGFGKWYYGQGRKTAEAEIPAIKELLAQVEEPHHQLHHSAQDRPFSEVKREGLCSFLSSHQGFDIVGEAGDGLEATRLIKKKWPKTKILALTLHKIDEYITATLKAGADGYILKDSIYGELIQSIEDTLA